MRRVTRRGALPAPQHADVSLPRWRPGRAVLMRRMELKHLPTSTGDLLTLSSQIREYMASGSVGYWHTVGVVTFVGCWKHAWSVPGAAILVRPFSLETPRTADLQNILVGSILPPIPALTLLTFITATGSLFCYLLSQPLAPLLAVLFPRPLAIVNNALSSSSGGSVWRRLLIMRATGLVPWSGMNVACGVVGVDWRMFWLTTAAGTASWSYVTASVGDILSKLPTDMADGGSVTNLLKDPSLIAKLVILSALSLVPVFLKRGAKSTHDADAESIGSAATDEIVTPPNEVELVPLINGLDELAIPPLRLTSPGSGVAGMGRQAKSALHSSARLVGLM